MRMSAILYGIGGLALLVGVALAGFGIPVSEFSFGNTLIMAGATVGACGLIVIALAAVTAQLQALNDLLGHGVAVGPMHEAYEGHPAAAESYPAEPRGPAAPPEFPMPAAPAPTLRNPEEPPQVEEVEASLSPESPRMPAAEVEKPKQERTFEGGWPRPRPAPAEPPPQRSTFFDSMWPPESKMLDRSGTENEQPGLAEAVEPKAPPAPEFAEAAPPPPAAEAEPAKPRAVAILKSGVVDGMSYTLYVDGSIEAELPQGTLRFASIHELRAHLEKNG
jgi:hypothetical protein